MGTNKKKKHNKLLLLLLIPLLLAAGVAAWFIWGGSAESAAGNGNLIAFDQNAEDGSLPGKTEEEIQAALNAIVEEGMFNISIAPEITFADGSSEGQVRIENIQANRYHMQVTITLDDSGKQVYASGAIKPGQFIESIKLSEKLAKGSYPATAVFTALDQQTLAAIGTAAAKITLIVEQ